MWCARLYLFLVLAAPAGLLVPLGGCASDSSVKPNPVPSGEKLKAADCDPAVAAYRQLLRLPPRVGMVVTNRVAPVRSEDEQARAAQTFAAQCPTLLAGKVRRAVLRCWVDAPDTESFNSCSQRF
ncbi:MAG TPA: hypothetical protein PLW65_17960 [Pseudomonadota bacterium]|nr:hypothetical protein [Pseudomonadota bacterium]